MIKRTLTCLIIHLLALSATAQPTFQITFDPALQPEPYSGRVYIAMGAQNASEPRLSMTRWFRPPQILSVDVQNVPPGGTVTIDASALAYPVVLTEIPAQEYSIQAVARKSPDNPNPGTGQGDLYSEAQVVSFDPASDEVFSFKLTKEANKRPFKETDRVKLFEIKSTSLSAFHERDVAIRAGVVLPEGYNENPDARYPVIYHIGGFGGTHHSAQSLARSIKPDSPQAKVLHVVPDPSCYRGHNVFADSANNGPWGHALVHELIPQLEQSFRGTGLAKYRHVTGGSSGGWSSLWLQIAYPDQFAACWSHVPDPVDFRDFQQIDLYTPGTNMYMDEEGQRRPLARSRGNVSLWYDEFVKRERVLGPGGQIHSFEAVFSPQGPDGEPVPLFDRDTGFIDTAVALMWEKYDIRLFIERNWEELEPKIAGKLHIYAGEVDTFYLEGAAILLQESLTNLGSDAEIIIVPGMGHSSYAPGNKKMYETVMGDWARRSESIELAPAGEN